MADVAGVFTEAPADSNNPAESLIIKPPPFEHIYPDGKRVYTDGLAPGEPGIKADFDKVVKEPIFDLQIQEYRPALSPLQEFKNMVLDQSGADEILVIRDESMATYHQFI